MLAGVARGIKGVFASAGSSAGRASSAAMGGTVGMLGVAGTAFSIYSMHGQYASTYGTGGALAMGLGEAAWFALPPVVSLPGAAIAYGALSAYDYGRDTYRNNRRLNLGQPINDTFGTMATMRQRSSQTLNRGRAILGSEARLMHY